MTATAHANCKCAECKHTDDICGTRYRCLPCDIDFCSVHVSDHDESHAVIPFHFAAFSDPAHRQVDDQSLSALLATVFEVYSDRPCIGLPAGTSAGWIWHSFADVWHLAGKYREDFRGAEGKFVVGAFAANSVEGVAVDIAATCLGLCSVVVHGAEQTAHVLELLGISNCIVVCGPTSCKHPPEVIPHWIGDDSRTMFTLFCTSGSTGKPKLVIRSRAAWLDTARDTAQFGAHLCVTLTFASLAHSGPRTELWWNLSCGGQTAFWDPDVPLVEALVQLSPTEIAAPPAVWVEFRRSLKLAHVVSPKELKRTFPRLIRRLHSVSTGSARCDAELFLFLSGVFGREVSITDNYGATEVGAIATDGVVNFNVKAKLVEIPELGVFHPRGEICVQCADAFEGYFGDAEATKAAWTPDGYYRTGDIGEQVRDGVIRVVDRVAGVVKLSNGKFCSLESIESQVVSDNAAVEQACALELAGSVVLVVHAPLLEDPLPWLGVPSIRAVERFTVANGMLTPSLKLCRSAVRERHQAVLQHIQGTESTRVKRLLAQLTDPGIDDLDENLPLSAFGVTSLQFAQLAIELGASVHAVASAQFLKDLRALSTVDSLGLESARDDISRYSQACASQTRLRESAPAHEWKTVLVLGATGHIGRHFVELVEAHGLVVVRASRSLGYDVSRPKFGLDNESYRRLVQRCDAVIHCAAIVNWSLSYTMLRKSNVESITHVAEFCHDSAARFCKPLLVIGSGVDFPECPASVDWLEECVSPYMVSKVAAEVLVHKLCPHAVVVRPGLVVWHSDSGEHNIDDAVSRLAHAFSEDEVAWRLEDENDDYMDGMNVDSFCRAAYAVFKQGGPSVYNMRGSFRLSRLLGAYRPPLRRLLYVDWHAFVLQQCKANLEHPLAALLPHLDAAYPPFASRSYGNFSMKCKDALGADLVSCVSTVAGYSAFVESLQQGKGSTSGHNGSLCLASV